MNLFPGALKLHPTGGSYASGIFNMKTAGLGIPTSFSPAGPPQAAAAPYLTHQLGHNHAADCPTCNLVEIPYNPNLPVLDYTE